ncbi:MAG: DUF2721 domain-containing protein [Oligoflexia bacterium]|nr:DUF2721 domain-containing protein [Oligoflexia bacterium]
MNITITTPGLLFSAISLLFLAYNSRFLSLAQLIRNLHAEYQKDQSMGTLEQIKNLRKRLKIIQLMEFLGVLSFVFSLISMLFFLIDKNEMGTVSFIAAIITLIFSLLLALLEIQFSIGALKIILQEVNPSIKAKNTSLYSSTETSNSPLDQS